jgi:hypothetical protein
LHPSVEKRALDNPRTVARPQFVRKLANKRPVDRALTTFSGEK